MSSFKTILFAILALLPIAANANSPLEPKLAPAQNCEAKLLTQQEQEALADSIAQQENQILKEENELANKQKELSEEKLKVAQSKLTLEANQAQNASVYRGKTRQILKNKAETKEKGPSILSRVFQKTGRVLKKMLKPLVIVSALSGVGYGTYHYAIDIPSQFEKVNGHWIKQVDAKELVKIEADLNELNEKIQNGELTLTADELVEKTNQILSLFKETVYIDKMTSENTDYNFYKKYNTFSKPKEFFKIFEAIQITVDSYSLSQNLTFKESAELGSKAFIILKNHSFRLEDDHYYYGSNQYDSINSYNYNYSLDNLVLHSYEMLDPILEQIKSQKMSFDSFNEKATQIISKISEISSVSEFNREEFINAKVQPAFNDFIYNNKEAITQPEVIKIIKLFSKNPHGMFFSIKSYLKLHTELPTAEAVEIIKLYANNKTNFEDLISDLYLKLDHILEEIKSQKMSFDSFKLKASQLISEVKEITSISDHKNENFKTSKLNPAINDYIFSNKETLTQPEIVEVLKMFKDIPHEALPAVKSYLQLHTELTSAEATEIINLYVTNGTERAKLYEEFITRQLEKKKVDALPKKED